MAADPQMTNAAAITTLNAMLAILNTGGAGNIKLYTGSVPTDMTAGPTGTLLATLTLSATAFPTATTVSTDASATANAITSDTNAAASGTATYFRASNGAGTRVIQGTVGTATSDMILNTTTITAGDTVAITSWVVTLPTGA